MELKVDSHLEKQMGSMDIKRKVSLPFRPQDDSIDFIDEECESFVTSSHKLIHSHGGIVDEIKDNADRAIQNISDAIPACPGYTKQITHKLEEQTKMMNASKEQKSAVSAATQIVTPNPTKIPLKSMEIGNIQARNPKKSSVIETPFTSVKNLKNRWEISSTTGTPLHPDQRSDELLEAALRMSHSVIKTKFWNARPQSHHTLKTKSLNSSINEESCSNSYSQSAVFYASFDDNEKEFSKSDHAKLEVKGSSEHSCEKPIAVEANRCEKKAEVNKENLEPNKLIDEAFNFINLTLDKNISSISISSGLFEDNKASEQSSELNVPLAYSVSFYRKKEKEIRGTAENAIVFGELKSSSSNSSLPLPPTNPVLDQRNYEKEKARIEKAISIQQEQIVQASHALSFCHQTQEFRGSREEVDAQRALLIATESRRALILALDHLIQDRSRGIRKPLDSPRGTLIINNISVKLLRDFINGHINNNSQLYYFIILIRHGETIRNTILLTSDYGLKNGRLEFPHYIQLNSLPHDFICTFEIYALRTRREVLGHYEKYHIKNSGSTKKKPSVLSSTASSPAGSSVIDPSFQRVGYLTLSLESIKRDKFRLNEALFPLDGLIEMHLHCYAEGTNAVGYRGFLSLYQPVENIASWTRFWCALDNGYLSFWRYPEDEMKKEPVVVIDLRSSACDEVKVIPIERCPYPNSMQIDVWIPSENPEMLDKIRILMAADKKDEMHKWLNAVNTSLRTLTLWNPKR